jgi:hypothetical protein
MYVSKLLNNDKQNYTATKHKLLVMVYTLQIFTLFTKQKKHILSRSLGIGIFDLQETTFMTNCSFVVIGFIIQFSIIHKHEQFYLVIDVHFLLLNCTKDLTMLDQTTYVTFFILQLIWLQIVYDNLHFGKFATQFIIEQSKRQF